jgi:hypothetical protein
MCGDIDECEDDEEMPVVVFEEKSVEDIRNKENIKDSKSQTFIYKENVKKSVKAIQKPDKYQHIKQQKK